MAKLIEYDVTGVEESGGGTGIKVKPGVRVAKIVRAVQRTENRKGQPANDIEIALDFGPEFDWGFTYVGLGEASDWKLAELIRAVGLKDKGKMDPDKLVGKIIRVKVNHGTYDGQYSPDIGKLFKAQPGDEDNLGQSMAESASQNGDGPVEDDAGDPDAFVPSREDDPEVGSYDDWDEEGLLAEVSDRGLTLPGGRGSKKDKAVAALRADDNEAADAQDAEPEGDGDGPTYAEGFEPSRESDPEVGSYDDWDVADLEAEANDRGVSIPGGRGNKKDKIVAALRAEDEAAGEGGSGGETQAGDDNYDEWDVEQLTKEWNDRSLGDVPKFRGSGAADRVKAAIIEKLREDDESSPFAS